MSAIQKVVSAFDSSSEEGQLRSEAVQALAKAAEARADLYEMTIKESLRTAGKDNNQTVPVKAIVSSSKEIRAFTSSSAENLPATVKESLAGFLGGTKESVLSGVSTLLSGALAAFLGESSASTGTIEQYYVMTEYLSVVRVDVKAYFLSVQATSIKTHVEKVCAVVAVKSTVDLSAIDFNTFLYYYRDQLSKADVAGDDLDAAIDDALNIYEKFLAAHARPTDAVTALNRRPGEAVATFM